MIDQVNEAEKIFSILLTSKIAIWFLLSVLCVFIIEQLKNTAIVAKKNESIIIKQRRKSALNLLLVVFAFFASFLNRKYHIHLSPSIFGDVIFVWLGSAIAYRIGWKTFSTVLSKIPVVGILFLGYQK